MYINPRWPGDVNHLARNFQRIWHITYLIVFIGFMDQIDSRQNLHMQESPSKSEQTAVLTEILESVARIHDAVRVGVDALYIQ